MHLEECVGRALQQRTHRAPKARGVQEDGRKLDLLGIDANGERLREGDERNLDPVRLRVAEPADLRAREVEGM